jgi:diguanylate cyclase (GGDEF)-like protein
MSTSDEGLNQPITDPLTGAYSRALLASRLAEELGRAARGGTGCSLFLFDVDHFKSINDSYGHPRGDDVLREMVQRIQGLVRTYDSLYRYGGDEFVLLLPETARVDAIRVGLRLVDGVRSVPFAGDPPLTVSVSLGVASFPDDASDADGLLQTADRRNYLAKGRGRACAVADDVEGKDRAASSRLLERDTPLSEVQEFLTRLMIEPYGALRVSGDRGAGCTRFMAEVAKLGRLRGYHIIALASDPEAPPAPPPPDVPLLVTADRGTASRAGRFVAQLLDREPPPPRLGVVYAADGWIDTGLGVDIPVLAVVELVPWTPAALRIWLRTILASEPSATLVTWLMRLSGGLPARAERELDRLTARGGLLSGNGGCTVAPAILEARGGRRRKLPQPVTELVGRRQETGQVAQLLTGARLVTLTGPGGIGKSRLSLAVGAAVADGFADGVVFVPVAEATSIDLVITALASALEVTEVPDQALLDSVAEAICEQSILLVIDNFEQVVAAAPVLSTLLAAAPRLRILVSSRERLSLYGEQVYAVPPLPVVDLDTLPPDLDPVPAALARSPALALFHTRARAANHTFTLRPDELSGALELCGRLDGLPLAIELAAAHCDTLTPEEMLAQLSDHVDLAGSGPRDVPDRQQTLRKAIDWSLNLLDCSDLRLFTDLGAFSGGCSLDAVAAIYTESESNTGTEADLAKRLDGLCAKSLLQVEPGKVNERRYRMLETIRVYAAERFSADPERDRVRARHAAYYARFAAACADNLTGADQAHWASRVEQDYPNLRSAFELLVHSDAAAAATVVLGLWRFWRNGRHIGEGREWLRRVRESGERIDDSVHGRVLHASAILAAAQDENDAARTLAQESLRLALQAGEAGDQAQAHNALGIAAMGVGDYLVARGHFQSCLQTCSDLDEPLGMAIAYGNLSRVALRVGDVAEAGAHVARCLEIERAVGNIRGIQMALTCQGEILLARQDISAAQHALQESLALSRALGDVFGEAMALHQLGQAARMKGDEPEAIRLTTQALVLRHGVGDREDLAISLDTIAVLTSSRDAELAGRLLGAADVLRQRHRLPVPAGLAAQRDSTRQRLSDDLGEPRLAQAFAMGRLMSLDLLMDEVGVFADAQP